MLFPVARLAFFLKMMRKLFLATFFLTLFHPVQAQLEYALAPEKREILESDFERLCELDFDADFEFGNKEKWESVLKRVFGMEKIDCLEFKKFIEARVGLIVDHYQIDNLVTINFYGTVKRQEDWNFLFKTNVEASMEAIYPILENPKAYNVNAIQLTGAFSDWLYEPSNKRRRNFIFALEYTTNAGEKNIFPIFFEKSVPGVVFLTDRIFAVSYSSFDRIAVLIHEARHESREFFHVHCLNFEGTCDNVVYGPYALAAIFLAYIAGICGDGCGEIEKGFLVDDALRNFQQINVYRDDNGRKYLPLKGQLKDRQLALDIYEVMTSLEN